MEINNNLESYVVTFDNIMPSNILKNFKRICKNNSRFQKAAITGSKQLNTIDESIRKASTWDLKNTNADNLTEAHWANFLIHTFSSFINDYQKITNCHQSCQILDIQILKYGLGGHYKFHYDHCEKNPRTLSCIFLVNDNYEGGELVFKYPNSKLTKIDKKENRMIIWPSNFLYPHSVKPVTKGERISVVTWAL